VLRPVDAERAKLIQTAREDVACNGLEGFGKASNHGGGRARELRRNKGE
jgi:hypothetical protein